MKKFNHLTLWTLIVFLSISFSCSDDEENTQPKQDTVEFPTQFRVDIPDAISNNSSGGKLSAINQCQYDVSWVYEGLPNFIKIGESASELSQQIVFAIAQYNLSAAQAFEYTSNDDGRVKSLEVKENMSVDGVSYSYGMQVKDKLDDAPAMQIFWNLNPVRGIAILNVYQIDRVKNDSTYVNTFFRINYTEDVANYDASMEVLIANHPVPSADTFAVDNIRMVASRIGDIVDVYGNSNHPQLFFRDGMSGIIGRNYAFQARGHETKEIGVATVAMPPSTVTSANNILVDYNILEVARLEYGNPVDSLLCNWKSPGHFNSNGFLGDGDYTGMPNDFTASFKDLSSLAPFAPNDISNLNITFVNF